MLRFFRQIRKTLTEQNKVRTYILYALGEISLVMIGILLALQVSNWNEERIGKLEETFYLNKLAQNLAQDTTYLQNRITGLSLSIESLHQLEEEIRDVNLPEFSSDSLHFALLTVHRFTPQTSTMDNLISTGKLDLIQNQSLVDSLFIYYNDLNNYPEQVNTSNDTYTRETIGPRMLDMPGGIINLRKSGLSDKEEDFIIHATELKRLINNGLRTYYVHSLNRARSIIDLIYTSME